MQDIKGFGEWLTYLSFVGYKSESKMPDRLSFRAQMLLTMLQMPYFRNKKFLECGLRCVFYLQTPLAGGRAKFLEKGCGKICRGRKTNFIGNFGNVQVSISQQDLGFL